ncbi:MAG: hypothetical protein GY765_28390, partial [bacterium]|nr:hypothetical protein [bacterium]
MNEQERWGENKCTDCDLIAYCPTCIGFNWQVHGDSAMRTTYHCEAYKLSVLATCKLEALRLRQHKEKLHKLPPKEKAQVQLRTKAILKVFEH